MEDFKIDEEDKMSEYDLSKYIFAINKEFGKDIENHACIKSVIEYQYNQRTFWFFNY